MPYPLLVVLCILFLAACFAWTRLSNPSTHEGRGVVPMRVPDSARGATGGVVVSLERHRARRRDRSQEAVVAEGGKRAGGQGGTHA
jgi:hypothetical protein